MGVVGEGVAPFQHFSWQVSQPLHWQHEAMHRPGKVSNVQQDLIAFLGCGPSSIA